MRTRLTLAMVALVAVTVVLTGLGAYVLIQRAAVTTARSELVDQGRAVSETLSSDVDLHLAGFRKELAVIRRTGNFDGVAVLRLRPDGVVVGTPPSGLTLGQLDVPSLTDGRQVTGQAGTGLVFTAVPTPLATRTAVIPIVVVTRKVHDPADGVRYFGLVGAVALALAAVVAVALSRRITRPLLAAVGATERIAAGDLDATVDLRPGEDREFVDLATAITSMAGALSRARDQERQFLLSVSHELRTPLTSIRGYADAVLDGAVDDPVAAATVISGEARRLERLVQDLLDLARLDADRFSLTLVPTDAAAVAATTLDGFRPRATELGLALLPGSEEAGPCWVQADPDRLGQILGNLVENASSFATSTVVVGVGRVEGRIALWVTDDGPGIPPEQLHRVFERHYTSDRGTGRRGSGLGLAIVAELAAAMGATVHADSPVADDHGTRMSVWFPLAASDPATVAAGGPAWSNDPS